MGKAIFWFLFLSAVLLQAHPPKSVTVGYNAETATLSVSVIHRVSEPETHFVGKIEVYAGEELLAARSYERQDTDESQEDIFLFTDRPLREGTEVTVIAYCSISGKKSAALEW